MATSKKTFYKLLAAGAVLLLILGITIGSIHAKKANKIKKETDERDADLTAGPVVKAYKARYQNEGKEIVLIGEARPFETATIYSKITGYLVNILVDKGDRVSVNQVLANIDNPEIDQQYNAAKADLENKRRILDRDKKLLEKKYISQEEEELSATNVATAEATFKSLTEQQQYKILRAPFSGTVTARYVDPGALVQSATSSVSSSQAIVTISTLDKLRIYVYVEQKDAGFLKNGFPVDITVNENPDLHIKGTITRFAGELDPHTRMMMVEIDVDNHKQDLVAGSYVNVHIKTPRDKNTKIQVPSNALVVHKDKTMLAFIDKDSVLHFKPVVIGENNGDSVTLISGIEVGQLIAVEVGENFPEGQKVRIQADSTNQKAQGEPAQADNKKNPSPKEQEKEKKAEDKIQKMGNKKS